MNCTIGPAGGAGPVTRLYCYCTSNSPLTVSVDNHLPRVTLVTNTSYNLRITTEFAAPQDGVIYPTTAGYYYIEMLLYSTYTNSTPIAIQSDYIFIEQQGPQNLIVYHELQSAGQPNIFSF
jgi:hypothetical protein